jgi:type I restriction enzyme, R subunit
VFDMLRGVDRSGHPKAAAQRAVAHLGTEDVWFTFRRRAKEFFDAYAAVSPDPFVLPFKDDLTWCAVIVSFGASKFEHKEEVDFHSFSEKIRSMLAEHLQVTGLATLVKLRALSDPQFWFDFDDDTREGDLQTAAIRKLNELRKILTQKVAENPGQYARFSERVRELLEKFEQGQLDAAQLLKAAEDVAKAVVEEGRAFEQSTLAEKPYAIWKLLIGDDAAKLETAARDIAELYESNHSAPPGWHQKTTLMQELRQQVRRIARDAGAVNWQKDVPDAVEQFALRAWLKA